jgi:hypothetical protein
VAPGVTGGSVHTPSNESSTIPLLADSLQTRLGSVLMAVSIVDRWVPHVVDSHLTYIMQETAAVSVQQAHGTMVWP